MSHSPIPDIQAREMTDFEKSTDKNGLNRATHQERVQFWAAVGEATKTHPFPAKGYTWRFYRIHPYQHHHSGFSRLQAFKELFRDFNRFTPTHS